MRNRALLLSLALTAACGPDGQPTGDEGPEQEIPLPITVSGAVTAAPPATRWLDARGERLPPLAGLRLVLEEPLRASLSDPDATLQEVVLAGEGAFRVEGVNARAISAALAARVQGDDSAPFVPLTTVLFDTLRERDTLESDLNGAQVFAIPRTHAAALSSAVGEAAIRDATHGLAGTVLDAGFVIGRVMNAEGVPRAGARVVTLNLDGSLSPRPGRMFYLAAGGGALVPGEATDESGVFLYLHGAQGSEILRMGIEGEPDSQGYAVSRVGVGMWLDLGPR